MMPSLNRTALFVCRRCLRASGRFGSPNMRRCISQSERPAKEETQAAAHSESGKSPASRNDGSRSEPEPEPEPEPKQGAMTRRLQEATEEALFAGGAAGRRAVEDAGFSEELKEKLLGKIADAEFRSQHPGAFAEAGQGTERVAPAARPWTGEEAASDAVLRMLDDARKPLRPELRGKFEPPAAAVVDARVKRAHGMLRRPGEKAAAARDRASLYASMGMKEDKGLSEEEREELKREFRARFEPAARAVPATISGLAALANERIEDAIARGQFRDLPRGKALERDPGADNPFVDTTEYLMNRIIRRQEIVPPWIEKQQELARAAGAFRARLRGDWKRHVARMVAAEGGSLEEQVARAEGYAEAERLHNPRLRQQRQAEQQEVDVVDAAAAATSTPETTGSEETPPPPPPAPLPGLPFRDPEWEKAEHAYLSLSVENLNGIARSYNLMAPELAKKPYYSLRRELEGCFADVAPLVAGEIRERATRPAAAGRSTATKASPSKLGGIVGGFGGGGEGVRIYEAKGKPYGFKEWWEDLWKKG